LVVSLPTRCRGMCTGLRGPRAVADAISVLVRRELEIPLHPLSGLPFFRRGGGRQAVEDGHRCRHVLACLVEERWRSFIVVDLVVHLSRTGVRRPARDATLGVTYKLGAVALQCEPRFLELPLLRLEPLLGHLRCGVLSLGAGTGGGTPCRSSDPPFGPRLSTSPSWSFAMWHSRDGW
jgi:hypothetical protein